MDARRLPDVADSLEWNLVIRESYTATELGDGTYRPIPSRSVLIEDSHVLQIGVKSSMAMAHWHTGGWAAQWLLTLPSTTSEFTATVQSHNIRLRLGTLNLCVFPKLMEAWLLRLNFPRWLKQATVEVWRYDGRDIDLFNQGATAIQSSTVDQSTNTVILVAESPDRKGVAIANKGTADLTLSTGVTLVPGGYYETPFGFRGQVSGSWAAEGTGSAEVQEFR